MSNAARIRAYLGENRALILEDLLTLVRAQSPTSDKAAADRCGAALGALMARRLGLSPTVHPQAQYGDHLSFRCGSGEKHILYVGHFDTVWDVDALPLVVEDAVIRGPGVHDMKFGNVAVIWALRALRELDIALPGPVELFFNADEEAGSPTSRPLIEAACKGARAAVIGEPGTGPKGILASSRSGGGKFLVTVTGRASHAGSDHAAGRSAVGEAARQVLAIHALTDYEKGSTTNVGVIRGGTKRNVVAAQCVFEVDTRAQLAKEARRIEAAMRALSPGREGLSIQVQGGFHRPPFEDSPASRALFSLAQDCAAELGMAPLIAEPDGGLSDGNLTAAAGVPTLDGIGAVGGGAHAFTEHILVEPSLERIPLLALLLTRL